MRKSYFIVKRIFDIICAVAGIVGTSPFWIAAIVGIEVSDPGPVFYMANRIGYKNKVFKMFKFRSMRVSKTADEKSFKADCNRIFAWGAFMRATKIDELPQLLNLLTGDMSVVGPRPASTDQADIVRAGKFAIVSDVKPGLTSPSALYDYIYGDTVEDEEEYEKKVLKTRLELDYFYVNIMNFFYDIKMIFYTVFCIIFRIFKKTPDFILNELKNNVSVNEEYADREKVCNV